MATFTSYDAAMTAALENADFESTGSIGKAREFIDACAALDLLVPDSASDQGSAQSFNAATRDRLRMRAQALVAVASGSQARFYSFNTGGFR